MKYRGRDLPAMAATAAGRRLLKEGFAYRLWPFASFAARLYRKAVVRRTHLVAVTGSFGKSSTVRAIAAALDVRLGAGTRRNAWSYIAVALWRIRRGQPHAVLEIGISAPGQMVSYARTVVPDVVVVTSIGSEHRSELHTLETTRNEKARLVEALPATGTAILNGDDPNVGWMRGRTAARVVTFGLGEGCAVRGSDVALDWPRGLRLTVHADGETRELAAPLFGRKMAHALLAAVAVARHEGIGLDTIVARLRTVTPVPGRLEPVALPGGAIVLRDDHKASLETIYESFDTMMAIAAPRRIVLLGDQEEAQDDRATVGADLGRRVAAFADAFVYVGERLEHYRSGALAGGMPASAIHDGGPTAASAAAVLAPLLTPDTVLLVKGRGVQMLDRVRLRLAGRTVRCDIPICRVLTYSCATCPMLEPGWGRHRVIM
jgi:UDP-N-acetylmuramoyl-tripeptide--D-alanyl-D-alanine ligase